MPSQRINRFNEDVKRELSAIFKTLKDPRLSSGLISIVRVEVSNDLSYATVRFSALCPPEEIKSIQGGLKSAAPYIRRQLSQSLRLRKAPELRFVYDDSIAYGAHIAKILNDIDIPQDSEDSEDE